MISMATTYITSVSQSVSDMIILSLAGRSDQQKTPIIQLSYKKLEYFVLIFNDNATSRTHVLYTFHCPCTIIYTQRHLRLIRIADWSINTTFNETSVASHTATEASVVVFLNVSRYYQAESSDRLRLISSNSAQVFISKHNFGNDMYFGDPF